MDDISLRPATGADAQEVANVYLESRKAFVAFAPIPHSDDGVRNWIADSLVPGGGVTVAARPEAPARLLGMMALARDDDAGWIDHLYLAVAEVGRGLGTRFVEQAKRELGAPIRLHTFEQNEGARRFYERHGFRILERGDGSGNEEGCPDILYEWT